ncbi:phage baseplate assembly protein V [Burkholderia sp. AU45388]|uniref:phage baseplate assembly protein V n=1 Tax=Burkholderia sp. AU45388 TaxID=3059206 RepID=UPI00264E32C1|nr:phage baseplate assembly protein V [Burkholderia sp. AU45388]MDN7430523.1 phage baseplate assembly protein V [Burkholderia sp. AU45388]
MGQAQANEAQRQQRNGILRGRVVALDLVDPTAPRCRVAVGDPDTDGEGLTTNWLPWKAARAGKVRTWSAPSIGEPVVIDCPGGDPSQGVVSGAEYSDDYPAPSTSPNEHLIDFPDGGRIVYDDASHALTVALPAGATIHFAAPASVVVETKDATIKAETVTLDAKQTTCKGKLTVEGPFTFLSGATGESGEGGAGPVMQIRGSAHFTDDVKAGDISLRFHPHMAQGEFALVSPPIAGKQ